MTERWPVTVRLLVGSLVALVAICAVGAVSFTVISRQRAAIDYLTMLSRTQRILQDADMEHDVIRADVLAIDNTWTGSTAQDLQRQLDHDIGTYRQFLIAAQAMPLPPDLRKALTDIEPQIDTYVTNAANLARLAQSDHGAVSEKGQPFRQSFDQLSAVDTQLTDLFAARVSDADARADAAARTASWAIGLACLAAIVAVSVVGRMVTRSIASALGRVRSAAEAISGGDLSVRSTVPVRDDIGAVADAVNRMADTLQTMIGRLQAEQEQDAFSRHLSEVLDMADTETDTHLVVARGMAVVSKDLSMELLVADSSRAHLERAAAHPSQGAPGCGVESPYACMAVRRGNPIVFESSDALNACTHLRDRPCGSISAVCVPLSFMGRSIGVLHAAGRVDEAPAPAVIAQLTTLGILAGSRIGTVRAFQRTQVQARTDALTGLANRRTLESRVRALGVGAPYALVMADLDHFKRLNDKHGHDAGDHALRVFADVLRQSLRDSDQPVRWGGEEFALLLEGRDASAALEIVERIRAKMAVAMQGAPAVTASFGIADSSMAGTFEQILRIADDALYESKEAGRDRGTIGNPARLTGRLIRRHPDQPAAISVDDMLETTGALER